MRIALLKNNKIYNTDLPLKINGSFWIEDRDINNLKRNLLNIEAKETLNGILASIKDKGTKLLDASDPFLKYAASDAGGKKVIGGGIKNIYKDIGNNIIDSLTPEGAS